MLTKILAVSVVALLAAGPVQAAGCKVAIDIGHSRTTPGATSARGVSEWTFNAALAEAVLASLRQADVPAEVLNPNGSDIPLTSRPHAAAAAGATLLISLHHDDVQDKYKSEWLWEGHPYQHGEHFSGFGVFVSGKNRAFAESLRVARAVADGLRAGGISPSLHHAEKIPGENRPLLDRDRGLYRYDNLVVLKSARMPAVLIEAGIIVNKDDEPSIASPAYRSAIADAVALAAADHCRRVVDGTAR